MWPELPESIPRIDQWLKDVDAISQSTSLNTENLKREERELQQRKNNYLLICGIAIKKSLFWSGKFNCESNC